MKKTAILLLCLLVSASLPAAYRNTELLWEADFRSADALNLWKDGSAAQYLPAGGPDGSPARGLRPAEAGDALDVDRTRPGEAARPHPA